MRCVVDVPSLTTCHPSLRNRPMTVESVSADNRIKPFVEESSVYGSYSFTKVNQCLSLLIRLTRLTAAPPVLRAPMSTPRS